MFDMFTKATTPGAAVLDDVPRRERFVMPEADGELTEYVTAIKPEAPFDGITIGLVDFAKYVMPPEASDVKRQNERFMPRFLTKLLAENQAEAIQAYADKRIKTVADGRDNRKNVIVGDFLILQKKAEFSPFPLPEKQVPDEPGDLAGQVAQGIYDAQGDKKNKGKK